MTPPPQLTVQQLEASLSSGLLAFAKSAFKARNTIEKVQDVYALYATGDDATPDFRPSRAIEWVHRVKALGVKRGAEVIVQELDPATGARSARVWPSIDRVTGRMRELDKSLQLRSWPGLKELWYTFYHFRSPRFGGNATKRIYIHSQSPVDQYGLGTMSALLKGVMSLPGFESAKIVAPGGADRADTIVAYFTDAPSLQRALDLLKSLPRAWFVEPVPTGVHPLNFIHPGIGGADQPPDFRLSGRTGVSGSFGLALSDILFEALKRLWKPNLGAQEAVLYRHFLDGVIHHMRAAGFDPKVPHLMQGDYRRG